MAAANSGPLVNHDAAQPFGGDDAKEPVRYAEQRGRGGHATSTRYLSNRGKCRLCATVRISVAEGANNGGWLMGRQCKHAFHDLNHSGVAPEFDS